MSQIRCVYEKDPGFPASDQHPSAVRYLIGGKFVDALDGEPTQAEVQSFLNPPAIDQSDIDQLQKQMKAVLLCVAQAGGLTVPQIRAMFKAKWDALP